MRLTKAFLLLMLAFNLSAHLFAQTKTPDDDDEVIRVDTQLVDVPVIITDRTGKPLLNLKKNNFVVYEDGKAQEISDFVAVAAPFEVALVLDTSGSTRSDLPLIQRAAENFIASLRPGDRVSIISFDSAIVGGRRTAVSRVLSKLTDDRAKLRDVLAQVQVSNGTPYYDSLLQVVDNVFVEKPKDEFRGRRALVALTDGVDSVSLSDFPEVREKFQQAGIISYFVQVDTREFFEENLLGDCEGALRFSTAQIRRYYRTFYPKSNGEKVYDFCQLGDFERLAISKKLYELAHTEMQDLAKTSGGKVFPVADLSEVRAAFKKVADEIGTKYSLGYYPSNDKRDGSFRKIKVELKGVPAGALIRAREGYTAPTR
ncbi:MAG TPA: VWA domain-containing protein [Pyrinomonadaceae bacterium]|jgi:VWFA-related protein